jgi:hypothetical protein
MSSFNWDQANVMKFVVSIVNISITFLKQWGMYRY